MLLPSWRQNREEDAHELLTAVFSRLDVELKRGATRWEHCNVAVELTSLIRTLYSNAWHGHEVIVKFPDITRLTRPSI